MSSTVGPALVRIQDSTEYKNGICSKTRRLSRLTTFIVLLNIFMAHGEIKRDAEGHVGLQGLLKKHPFVPPSLFDYIYMYNVCFLEVEELDPEALFFWSVLAFLVL